MASNKQIYLAVIGELTVSDVFILIIDDFSPPDSNQLLMITLFPSIPV
jgi:hypothetical protein